jgi:signal transduction histidine kinase
MKPGRHALLPAVVAIAAAVFALATRSAQERLYETVRDAYRVHAAYTGRVVRAAAQEAASATGLVYRLAEQRLGDLAALLGEAGPGDDCALLEDRLESVVLWVTRTPAGLRGCTGKLAPADRDRLIDHVLAATDPAFVDSPLTRGLGACCTGWRSGDRSTVLCTDRADLDRLRREVGLGPLLAGLRADDLGYVVLQDETGLLAATPDPGLLSAWADDPALAAARDRGDREPEARLVERPGGVVLEVVHPIVLGDGSRAVVRTGLDGTSLASLRRQIDRRQYTLYIAVVAAVLLSIVLAFVLDSAATRRKRLAADLRRREEEGRHWQAVGEMAATVAHEVRNPLNTIGMALQRLKAEFEVPEADRAEFRDLLDVAGGAAERVERVVTEFLDLGRPLALDLRPWPAGLIVEDAAAAASLRASREGKSVEVEDACEGEVRVDRLRLAQVLANLAGNALDAVAAGGVVRISAKCDAERLVIEVADRGHGMDAALAERVMQPFVTTKANGTGLGLPLARRLVEAHGGRLVLESEPGVGTTARIEIPRAGRTG